MVVLAAIATINLAKLASFTKEPNAYRYQAPQDKNYGTRSRKGWILD